MSYDDEDYYPRYETPRKKRAFSKEKTAKPVKTDNIVSNTVGTMLVVGERKFFTDKKNFRYLVEAAGRLQGELSLVRILEGQLLSLKQIAECFNDPLYTTPNIQFEVLEQKISYSPEEIEARIISDKIKTIIRQELLAGHDVSAKSLEDTLKDYNMTKQQIKYYFNVVKKSLTAEGYVFTKISPKEGLSPEAIQAYQEIMKWNTGTF